LSLPLSPFPTPLKAIARGLIVLFHIGIGSPSTIYRHLNILPSPSPLPTSTHPSYTVPILQSWFLLFKLTFKRVSQCMPTVGVPCFGLCNPFEYSALPFYLSPSIFQQFLIPILISSTCTSYVMWYYWCASIFYSFPSFPEFHRVVSLSQTCSMSEFVYDHAGFCVYVYLWIYFPRMRENMWLLCFWS
jgi:hypothetical protein